MAKGELILKILDYIGDRAVDMCDILETDLFPESPFSFSRHGRQFKERREARAEQRLKRDKRRESERRLQKYISRLKQDGLLEKSESGKISLTKRGEEKLFSLKQKQKSTINKDDYEKKPGNKVIIISYDIPQAYNRERNILRGILKFLGFNMIHQSVWIGKVKIPKQFILDLETMGILDNIEILEVTKSGSLKVFN